jgi:hypothetical protein
MPACALACLGVAVLAGGAGLRGAADLPAWQAVSLMLVLTGAAFGGSLYGAAFPTAPRRHR